MRLVSVEGEGSGFLASGGWGAWLSAVRSGAVLAGLTGGEARVLTAVWGFANGMGECWASVTSLAEAAGLKHQATSRARRRLVDVHGLLAEAAVQDKASLKVVLVVPGGGERGRGERAGTARLAGHVGGVGVVVGGGLGRRGGVWRYGMGGYGRTGVGGMAVLPKDAGKETGKMRQRRAAAIWI